MRHSFFLKNIFLLYFLSSLLYSCSHKKQIVYLNDLPKDDLYKIDSFYENSLEVGDILKIDVNTVIPEASIPYNQQNFKEKIQNQNIDILKINGYLVDKDLMINYPILGKINVASHTENELAKKIKLLLIDGGHLTNPHVKVKKINSKFTVLGDVKNPGTFSYYDNQLNVLQALGFAGDLLITGKRKNITLIREENSLRKVYKFSLNQRDLLKKPFFYIKSNDVIIVEPNFSKIKSAGFIGSPSSIASISSLLLSITLLLINN